MKVGGIRKIGKRCCMICSPLSRQIKKYNLFNEMGAFFCLVIDFHWIPKFWFLNI